MSEIVIGLKVAGEAELKAATEGLEKLGIKAEVVSQDRLPKLSRSSTALSKSIDGAVRSLDPAVSATARYEREVTLLERGLELGKFSQERYNQLLAQSRARFREATNAATPLERAISSTAGQYLAAGAIVASATGILRESIRAAMEAEQSEIRLAFAVSQRAEAYGLSSARLSALASELQKTTRFEDDAIKAAEAILLRFDNIDGSNIEEITRLTLDFAEATGRDAPAAAEALGKALEQPGENLRALKESGIVLDRQQLEMIQTMAEAGRTAEAQGILIEALEAKIGGLSETVGQSTSGAWAQFKNMLGDLGKTLGGGFLAPFDRAIAALQNSGPVGTALAGLGTLIDIWRGTKKAAEEAAEPVVTDYVPALRQLEKQVADTKTTYDPWNAAMDEATDRMIAEQKEAKKLADEIERIRENMVAASNIEPLDVVLPAPTAPYLTPTGQAVPAALADEYREYLDLLGQGETIETRLNDLVNAGLITREQAAAALDAQLDTTVKMVDATDELEAEWKLFQEQVQENFIRGVQTALADFFVAVFEGGDDAMANFADALKDLLFKTLAEYLAQWLILQAKMLAASLARIAKEKAAQQAANAAGGGGGGGGGGAGAMGGAGMWVAVAVAVGAMVKNIMDRNNAKEWGTTSAVEVSGGAITAGWEGKLDQTGPRIAAGIANLLKAFQDATGAFITGVMNAEVQIRNDKKWVEVFVNEQFIGAFSDINKAIIAAAKAVFLEGDLSKALDPIVRQVIENYKGTDPEELAKAVGTVQEIMDGLSGLTDVEIALRDLPAQAAQLSGELQNMGVSMEDANNVALRWRAQQMQTLRDQITGHQQTAAEQMAERQRQAAMFNAELALMRAELEAKRAELIAKGAVVQASASIAKSDIAAQQQKLMADGELLKARIDLENADINLRKASLETQASVVAASTDLLNAQLAAIDAVLASLPTAIDMKEIRIDTGGAGGGRGGGGRISAGPSREERRDTVRDTLGDLAAELLPALVSQSRELTDRFADLRAEMVALGMDTAELDALEAAHRDRLREQAQAEVGQYTQSPYQQQLAEILRWGSEMREVYTELGLSLEEVEEAEKARLETLGQEAMAALGDSAASAALEMQDLMQAIEFLQKNAEALGLSAEEVGRAIEDAANSWGLSILDNLLQYVEDEEAKAMIAQLRYEMEIAMLMAQFEILVAMGKLAPEIEAKIREIFEGLPDAPPTIGGGGSAGGGMGGFGDPINPKSVGSSDKIDKLIRALDRLREFYENLYQDETISPLSLADRYALAAQEYADTLAAAQAGDEEAIAALPDVAQQYLELASQMFGTSTQAYQAIFEQVASDVQDLIGALEDTNDWQDLRDRLTSFGWQFSSMENLLEDIETNTGGGFGGGGTVGREPGTGTDSLTIARAVAGFRADRSDRGTVYRGVPGLPSNVVVYQPAAATSGDSAAIEGLRREIDRLGQKLERSLDKLGRSQLSAADQRVRAAGIRR